MGSNLHLQKYGNEPPGEDGHPLARQSSVYSLTFDEFLRGSGKDFGSMNMDELLKNICSAEEIGGQELGVSSGNLQRQGSLTLPRTLSHKTVDQVWKDISKEYDGGNDVGISSNMPSRQQTLGEITLEDFLVRAGVVREEAQLAAKASNFSDNNLGMGFGYQQSNKNTTLMASRNIDNNSESGIQSATLPVNVNGIRSVQQQQGTMQQQQPLFPKQPGVAYGAPMTFPSSGQLGSPGMRGGIVGISDPAFSSNLVQGSALTGGGMSMVGFGAGGVIGATASPAVSSDGLGRSNGDTSSISPVPYVFNGGLRGRKGGTVEKVVERRQRRMIKNRESAARSRARKQAYTMELEAEIAKLKEENEELQKKQAEMMEMQKNPVQEMMNLQRGAKRRCLRRTQTGPW
ncbi:bZIP transcription factor 46-like isoform X1 [Lycium ferocissimum]|uniref:bZIP transcription factor 46-like isoform X1 n=1 Tax=Lycium ferocissimum TaxID=112874 RepID=UPI0028159FE9|nr:bZIP transcription factor 46-like isoform X1 [Lycium ferocissimum]